MDFLKKQITLWTKSTSDIYETALTIDISTWSLSHLTTVRIQSSTNEKFGMRYGVKQIRINNTYDPKVLSTFKFNAGNWLALPIDMDSSMVGSRSGTDRYLKLQGTPVQTISSTHKIVDYSNTGGMDYWSCGCASSIYNQYKSMTTAARFKVLSSTDFKLCWAGVCTRFYLVDEDGNMCLFRDITTNKSLDGSMNVVPNPEFEPELNKWYYIYATPNASQTLSYISSYLFYAKGTARVEAEALGCFYSQAESLCASTCNGNLYSGIIPMKINGTPIFTSVLTDGVNYPPTFQLKIENNIIYMYNGSSYVPISN